MENKKRNSLGGKQCLVFGHRQTALISLLYLALNDCESVVAFTISKDVLKFN